MSVTPNEFLLRRQFLMMERKRTENLIAQTKAELQAQQRQLLAVRSQFQDVLALEETADADVENWRAPAPRTAFAWADFIKTLTPELTINILKNHTHRPQVAYCVGGGLGDVLKSTFTLSQIAKRLNCDITYFSDQPAAVEILKNNKNIIKVIYLKSKNPHFFAKDSLHHLGYFDFVMNWRYLVLIHPQEKFESEHYVQNELNSEDRTRYPELEKFVKYARFWPNWNHSLYRLMIRNKLSAFSAGQFSIGLDPQESQHIRAPLIIDHLNSIQVRPSLSEPYVTIHHGFDLRFLPGKSQITDYPSTKTLPRKSWKAIVARIKAAGFKVVQLGTVEEEAIPGVDLYLNGQTSLAESALIIKSAVCHVDTEGGLVHLAHAMHQRSVVLFGPTPVEIFGYPENINLEPKTCKGCWFATDNWVVECPRHTKGPQCMKEHRAEDVMNAINRIVQHRPKEMALCLALEISTDPRGALAQLSALRAEYSTNAAEERLVLSDLGDADINAYWRRNRGERERIAYLLSHVREIAGNPREQDLVSPLNLPDDDESLDLVTCMSAVWVTDEAPFLLREIFRVLKADGVLIAGVPNGAGPSIDIDALLLKAGLTRDGNRPISPTGTLFALKKRLAPPQQTQENCDPEPRDVVQSEPALIFARREDGEKLASQIAALEDANVAAFDQAFQTLEEVDHLGDQSWETTAIALRRVMRPHGWIECRSSFCDNYSQHLLFEGWSGNEDWGCWSVGATSHILLPFNPKIEAGETLEIELDFTALRIEGQPPLTLTLSMASQWIKVVNCEPENLVRVEIPGDAVDCAAFALLRLEVSATTRPSLWGLNANDHRELGIGLRRFRFRTFGKPMEIQPPEPTLTSKRRRFPFFI